MYLQHQRNLPLQFLCLATRLQLSILERISFATRDCRKGLSLLATFDEIHSLRGKKEGKKERKKGTGEFLGKEQNVERRITVKSE